MIHELPLERRTLHGHFSRDLEPVLTVEPGDSVRFATPNAGWALDDGVAVRAALVARATTGTRWPGRSRCAARAPGRRSPSGSTRSAPGPWGATFADGRTGSHWELAEGVGRASTGHVVRLAPFLGVLGMPPAEHGVHSTSPPRPQGGNIDCKELVAGTTLYLPIPVDGALFSAGDGHARAGRRRGERHRDRVPVHARS